MRVGFGTGRALSSEKRIRAPIASSDDCLVAHAINRGLSPIVCPLLFFEWGSVCRNYRSGSLEYRDCRKGAKVAFKNMCGSYRPACAAENGFRP